MDVLRKETQACLYDGGKQSDAEQLKQNGSVTQTCLPSVCTAPLRCQEV